MEIGFKLYDTMIYKKENYAPRTHRRYEQAFEYMFVFSKGVPKTFNPILVPCKLAGKTMNWQRKGASIKEGVFRRRDSNITVKPEKLRDNVWSYTCGSTRSGHPAPFPEQLAEDHILTWSNEGDLVYDPFAGGGTTLKMAQIHGRKWIGSEIAAEYVELIHKRLEPIN